MIDNKYYKGFEDEKEVTIYYVDFRGRKEGFSSWDGYFDTLIDGCFSLNYSSNGLIKYFNELNNITESPWKIPNLSVAINEIKGYRREKIASYSPHMIKCCEEVRQKLLSLLETAQAEGLDVYIEYD